jgi:hypothetical protein
VNCLLAAADKRRTIHQLFSPRWSDLEQLPEKYRKIRRKIVRRSYWLLEQCWRELRDKFGANVGNCGEGEDEGGSEGANPGARENNQSANPGSPKSGSPGSPTTETTGEKKVSKAEFLKKVKVVFENDPKKHLLEDRSKLDAITRDEMIDDAETLCVANRKKKKGEEDQDNLTVSPAKSDSSDASSSSGSSPPRVECWAKPLKIKEWEVKHKRWGGIGEDEEDDENENVPHEVVYGEKPPAKDNKQKKKKNEDYTVVFPPLPSIEDWDRLLGMCDCVSKDLSENNPVNRQIVQARIDPRSRKGCCG